MAMTNETINPAPKATLSPAASDVLKAADKLKAEAKATEDRLRAEAAAKQPVDETELLSSAQTEFQDQIKHEEQITAQLADKTKEAVSDGKSIADLCEDDAYNLEVAISAKSMYSPTALKIVMKDPNYIARWANVNPIRITQLIGQGFRYLKPEMVANLSSLEMFQDSQGNFMWADLTAMYVRKDIYYAGLRRSYIKSLHATNSKKAGEIGATFAKSNLQSGLSAQERNYMAEHEAAGSKPIYNPNIGV